MKNRLSLLKTMTTKKITDDEGIKTSFFENPIKLPMLMQPLHSGFDINSWVIDNRTQFEDNLRKYGGILCRGFGIDTVDKFETLMNKFPNDLLDYSFRSSPRFELSNNVYVSTTYPEDQVINMHSESSYAPNHPARIVFCCITPATVRGETPIADNRLILQNLSDTLRNKFLNKGVQYRRNLSGVLGLNWQEVFQTSDKKTVEAECLQNGMDYTWVSDDQLVLTWTKKAIWEHPITKELVWFNHGLFFNKYMLNNDILDSVTSDEELPSNTFFGDGTEISKQEIEELKSAYKKATVMFPWEKGDVLFLDNMLASHGRNSYKGERKIIVSIS